MQNIYYIFIPWQTPVCGFYSQAQSVYGGFLYNNNYYYKQQEMVLTMKIPQLGKWIKSINRTCLLDMFKNPKISQIPTLNG